MKKTYSNLKNRIFKKQIKVVYSFEYDVQFSLSNFVNTVNLMDHKKIRDHLVNEKLLNRKKIIIPEMVSYEDMALVHTEQFLVSIKDPLKVGKFLKLTNVNPWDSQILE